MPRVHQLAELLSQLTPFQGGSRPGFALWLGAGASKQSGVPLAQELVDDALFDFYLAHHPTPSAEPRAETGLRVRKWADTLDWLKNPDKSTYELVMENAFFSSGVRGAFLKRRILQPGISMGYRRLGQLMNTRVFDTVFTTNFDHLVHRGCEGLLPQPPKEVMSLAQYPLEQPSPSDPRLIRMHGDFYHGNILNSEGEFETIPDERFGSARRLLQSQGLIVIGYGGHDRRIMNELFHRNIDDPNFLSNGLFWCLLPGQQPPHHVQTLIDRNYKHPRISLFEIAGFDELMEAIARHFGIPEAEPDWMRRLAFSWSLHHLNRHLVDLIYSRGLTGTSLLDDLDAQFGNLTRHLNRGEGALIRKMPTGWQVVGARHFLRKGDQVDLSGPAWKAALTTEDRYIRISSTAAASDGVLSVLDHNRKIEALPVWREGEIKLIAVFASGELLDSDGDDFPIAQYALKLFALASEGLGAA